jgi:hypothetical protein
MKRSTVIFSLSTLAFLPLMSETANARDFGGNECTDDCSGHAAGYRWAEAHNITNESDCLLNGNATSFYEGCLVYLDDPDRGADEDDDGDPID